MKGSAVSRTGAEDPSAYWAEELENIDYLLDASPLIVRKLRHHAFHITGIRPYDYRSKPDGRREHFEARLRDLRELGGETLLVPESSALGGFGHKIDGRLFNVDTLKFYEVLIGMERGGVLHAIRNAKRPVVCEIGAGWAGFAYQFRTLFPHVTYVIVDFPELFLFSATYLGTVFPDARLLFAESETEAGTDRWLEADFVFVPNTLAHFVDVAPLDLAINMVSFQEMTAAQVRRYANLFALARCPTLYSLNRERSPYNTELASVSQALAEWYQLTEVPVLDTDYTSAMKKAPRRDRMTERSELGYRHLVGHLGPVVRASTSSASGGAPPSAGGRQARVVLGMTLYNNAAYLREAMDSLLAQSSGDFALILLDDASSDGTESIAREYEARDPRIRYHRHETRVGMIGTWREVVEIASRECPGAEYFAWTSDHDRWHPRWLESLLGQLDADPGAVLAYPITRRIDSRGREVEKGARLFDTSAYKDLVERWKYFCREVVGSGDMVYGLMRLDAIRRAGIFRPVLRPDKLLVTELTLMGRIRQVPEVLWFRRNTGPSSITRQRQTLMASGEFPSWFDWPPAMQHARFLYREYVEPRPARLGLSRSTWMVMLLRYELTYGWRHFRKSETFHSINRGIDQLVWVRKITRHHFHRVVYESLMAFRAFRGRMKRRWRYAVYVTLVTMHRLRGRSEGPPG